MKKRFYFLLVSYFLCLEASDQFYFFVGDTLEHIINQETKRKVIKNFLKAQKASKIEFNPNKNSSFHIRLKMNMIIGCSYKKVLQTVLLLDIKAETNENLMELRAI